MVCPDSGSNVCLDRFCPVQLLRLLGIFIMPLFFGLIPSRHV